MRLNERGLKKLIKETVAEMQTSTYGKMPMVRTSDWCSEYISQAYSQRDRADRQACCAKLPKILRSVEQFLEWYDWAFDNDMVHQDASSMLVSIAVADDRLSRRGIDRIEVIQRELMKNKPLGY